jgi:hypothetical protein
MTIDQTKVYHASISTAERLFWKSMEKINLQLIDKQAQNPKMSEKELRYELLKKVAKDFSAKVDAYTRPNKYEKK